MLVPQLVKIPVARRKVIPCGAPLTEQGGTVQLAASYTNPAYVIVASYGFVLGGGVAVTYTKTATGYSFSGTDPICLADGCAGKPSTYDISVSGTVSTAAKPGLEYTYTIDAYCGGVLTCLEEGTYSGARIAGSDILDADFRGTQTWKMSCCPERQFD